MSEKREFDVSNYLEGKITSDSDVIELACALANVNRLFEVGELVFSSDDMFKPGQLQIVKEALQAVNNEESEMNDKTINSMIKLYKRLKQLNP